LMVTEYPTCMYQMVIFIAEHLNHFWVKLGTRANPPACK
jgi:hypothetical protein